MRITFKTPAEVNRPQENLLKDFFLLGGGLIAVVVLVFFILGFIANELVLHMSPTMEKRIVKILPKYSFLVKKETKNSEIKKYVQSVFVKILKDSGPHAYDYEVVVVEDDIVNAFALPGGKIVLFTGFLDQVESENELAMVLGHELGHFKNRDHLRGYGRALVFWALLSALSLGQGSDVVSSFVNILETISSLKFNRTQEIQADEYGLERLYGGYNTTVGAADFFERLSQEEIKKGSQFYEFLSTHPLSKNRVNHIHELSKGRGWDKQTKKISIPKRIKKELAAITLKTESKKKKPNKK
ncbi:MAG TPA: M48 family metallopeptidase [Bdellovibrionota bacterium]|nr:M48 family metallopeptidase [Bdellovibrionota bacterium]